ncbi:MAG TPA: hypothetical protein VD996_06490 [Chitinophagaceae bacterium]|nr:hypothetical protein [Chitinophagaceae bacterium]
MKIIYTILACALFTGCAAQKNTANKTQAYAYRQDVLPGVHKQKSVTEEGSNKINTVDQPLNVRVNYLVYLASLPEGTEVKEVWINRQAYTAETAVRTAPVVIGNTTMIPGAKPDTLVKSATGKVLQVIPRTSVTPANVSAKLRSMINDNEVVVHCVAGGKDQYYTVSAIKKLSPVALQ